MLVIIGDLHLSSLREHHRIIGEEFLKFYENWELNNPDNEVLFVGDLVQSAINGGVVIDFLERLYVTSRFKKIHLLKGNHDEKRRDGVLQLSYEFLRNKASVCIYDRLTITNIQGHKILMLPHYIPVDDEPPMYTYYSSLHETELKDEEFTLIAGHFMRAEDAFSKNDGVANLDKLKSKYLCLGHLHTRMYPHIYIGSVYPNKINEHEPNRAAWIIDDNGEKSEFKLPPFAEFITVNYPDPLPKTDSLVPIYTITGCNSEKLVYAKYGKIHLRKIVRGLDITSKKDGIVIHTLDTKTLTSKALFREFLKAQSAPINRSTAQLCLSMLND